MASASRVVLITGASSGIGASAARLFAAAGDRVVLVARRRDRLDQLKAELDARGGSARVITADLARAADARELVRQTVEEMGALDVLVNNAGFGMQRRFADMSLEDVARMFSVNVLSAIALAHEAVQVMLPRGAGSIINVASVGGVVCHPLNVVYCSTTRNRIRSSI